MEQKEANKNRFSERHLELAFVAGIIIGGLVVTGGEATIKIIEQTNGKTEESGQCLK